MGEINDAARRLLREMGYQAEHSPTPDVLPREAAEHLGLDPGSREYELALEHLRALGDIEPSSDPALSEQGFYQITVQGRRRAREMH
jgi:hypothetical protein